MGAPWSEGVAHVWPSGASSEAEPRARLETCSGPATTSERALGRGWRSAESCRTRTFSPWPGEPGFPLPRKSPRVKSCLVVFLPTHFSAVYK